MSSQFLRNAFNIKEQLTKRFVVENELHPSGHVGEHVQGEEEDEGDGGDLAGQAHLFLKLFFL